MFHEGPRGATQLSSQFLKYGFDLKPPEIRLTSKILNTIAIVASKPPSHPLHAFYAHSQKTNPKAHRGPLHAFFQSLYADVFEHFREIQQPDPTQPIPSTPNFGTFLIKDKDQVIKATAALRPVPSQVIIYSDGSRIEKKNTEAAAWCENTKDFYTQQLGKATEYGIIEAEYGGLIIALQLARHAFRTSTHQVTIVLNNQGVVQDMSTKKTSSQALHHKIKANSILTNIAEQAPGVKVTLRWCPGHRGVEGNEEADKLTNGAAKRPLPPDYADKPTLASFQAAIKTWAEKSTRSSYTPLDIKRLGHDPHLRKHMKALTDMNNKHLISLVTQLRTGHIPLYHYLASQNMRTDSSCKCGSSPETVEHFLFHCVIHNEQRQELCCKLDELDIPFERSALNYPAAREEVANLTSSTCGLKSRWDWADVMYESVPKHKT